MSHGRRLIDADALDPAFAGVVAETMQALATASRVRILGRLRVGSCSVSELAEHVGMQASAVSHQLRVLRHLGLVVGRRDGRRVEYELHDEHVGQLLDEAISHVEHLRLGHVGHERRSRTLTEAAR
jgi:ArsR family transcriptional regulator